MKPRGSSLCAVLLALCCYWTAVSSQESFQTKNCLPPSLKSEGNVKKYIGKERIVIPCIATGNATLEYSWLKDGKPLDLQSEGGIDHVMMKPNSGTLVIAKTQKSDSGTYQCKVTNNCGTAMSKLTTLLYAEIEPFPNTPTEIKKPVLGASQIVRCKPPRSVPRAVVNWILESQDGVDYIENTYGRSTTGTKDENTVKMDDRVTMDFDGNLYITTVKKEDEQNGKKYVCQATNLPVRSSVKGQDTIIKVVGTIPSSNNVELMWHSPQTVLALQGRRVLLKCIFSGNPPPKVSWRREDGEIDRSRISESHFELEFDHVQFEDAGKYTCIGQSPVSNEKSYTFTLVVEAAPEWRTMPRDQTVGVGESVTFQCEANGRPKPVINWFINGVHYEDVTPNDRRELKDNSLVFTELENFDSQVIQCNASNVHGSIWADVILFVQALPPTIVKPPLKQLIVAESQVLRVSCEVTGKPKPQVQWYIGDQHLPSNEEYQTQENGDLLMEKAVKKYTGTYKCIASNKYGTEEATGEVIVKSKTVIETPPENNTVNYPDNATFTCAAKTDETEMDSLSYRWMKDGQPLQPSRRIVIKGGVLHILEATSKDTGKYTCVAESRLDNATSEATLSVKAVPDPPYNVTVVECFATSVLLKWKFDDKMSNFLPMSKFIVEAMTNYDDVWKKVIVATPQSREVSFDLSSWAKYTFRVKAVNVMGISEPSDVTHPECSTPMSVPDKNPDNVRIDPQHTDFLTVKWDPMEEIELNGLQFRYVIEIQEPGGEVETYTQDNFTIGEIKIPVNNTYQPYSVRVRAMNQVGKAEDIPKTVQGFSGEAPPLVVPENFERDPDVDLTETSAGFKWDQVNTSVEVIQGKFMGYRIRFWKKGQKDSYKWVDIPVPDPQRRRRSEGDGKVRGHVAVLPSNAEIELDVVVVNQYFESEGSNVVTIITEEGVPSEVAYFEALYRGSHHFLLEWGAPLEPNGNITGYQVSYQKIHNLDFDKRVYKDELDPDERRMNLKELEPNSQYRVYIQAKTRKGLGKEYYIDIVTQQDTLDVALPEVSTVDQTDTEANVTWKMLAPDKGIRYGQYYQLRYKKKGDRTWEKSNFVVEDKFWGVLEHLEPGTSYQVVVASYPHSNAQPRESRPYSFTTTGISASRASFLTAAWFIAMMVIIAFLILLLIIVCIIKRNRGDNYPVQEKERLRGNCDDNPDHFNEIGKGDDNGVGRSSTFDGDIEKVPLDEDTDSLDYGDDNASKFNEDGSFIGQYGRGEKGAEGTNASSIV